jgi:ribosome-binding factor A
MRIIPELSFEYDITEEKARHLDDIFARIHNENKDEN